MSLGNTATGPWELAFHIIFAKEQRKLFRLSSYGSF